MAEGLSEEERAALVAGFRNRPVVDLNAQFQELVAYERRRGADREVQDIDQGNAPDATEPLASIGEPDPSSAPSQSELERLDNLYKALFGMDLDAEDHIGD